MSALPMRLGSISIITTALTLCVLACAAAVKR
jgi:hypothetical protein